ncbi:phosphoribosylglycinamide formyltransferase [Clostridium folliculivorans]|uniref:Phosphoribosylglycinamide formyltransferase n=1 Tax=Clostridium folliculivorans TaxID=2886038 RepID=A0A9W6DAV4_9CLOT|nr:phosphoribosylglycinamide formyltransferase [Clostridium folliculivorans]GKU25351.1 phosphoribosylglycinamide formyltransferase [Clostridium folliculivorans]GKU28372.1 phosphoribosylglycinamide formyltransferase [Clostridium folliculivorans]
MFRIAVLVSGGGSNLGSIIESIEKGYLNCSIEAVISDKKDAFALTRAKEKNIPAYVVDKKEFGSESSNKILELLRDKVDLVVLAGYLSILNGDLLRYFKNRIINIHPSLIPAFSGAGMYGIKVHQAAIKKGVRFSGCTVHFVNEEVDGGEILLQEVVEVREEDEPKTLQERILVKEHEILPKAIKLISEGKVIIKDGKTFLLNSTNPKEVF